MDTLRLGNGRVPLPRLAGVLIMRGEQGKAVEVVRVDGDDLTDLFQPLVELALDGVHRRLDLQGQRQVGVDGQGLGQGLVGFVVLAVGQEHGGQTGLGQGMVGIALQDFGERLARVGPRVLFVGQEAFEDIRLQVMRILAPGFTVRAPGVVGDFLLDGAGDGGDRVGCLCFIVVVVKVEEIIDLLVEQRVVADDLRQQQHLKAGAIVIFVQGNGRS